ncbi:type VI secretion system contractile sheath large subunit [Pelomonas sp. P8]|uniref:Type VI secretion system contractile sheath large subunit n=1 Tax=Pelomonas cellulosilytica TaxID=2906762 RepID=A0ABS8XS19_9BURK|nr:type VI secretion system contractile sheath large subunit [Pelomonas sp. P8]MCE4554663.1 type VI secretion system contractile sheath large subunit [Pelomonas sp. P8]
MTADENAPLSSVAFHGSDLESLLHKAFSPKTDGARDTLTQALRLLALEAQRTADWTTSDVIASVEQTIAAIDLKLTDQLNPILHHPDFLALEGAWRGLFHLVANTETGTDLKIRVMNISKAELARSLRRYRGADWDQSPLFKKVYEEEFGQFGGEPFGCLVGDYHFDHSPRDVELLGELARIAAAAHAPFIAGASPGIAQMQSWRELAVRRDMTKAFETPEYAAWRSLRESDEARCVGLAMPRFLARLPYGSRSNPVEEFNFEEDTGGPEGDGYVWANSAYAMAANITRAFKDYGWCARIRGVESGGAVANLLVHTFPADDGGVDMKCPTEVAITDRREAELARVGFMPLVHRKNSDFAAFIGAQSLQTARVYDKEDATVNAALAARLPYLFACCRFLHYVKCLVRDKIGSFKERQEMEFFVNRWLATYVDPDPSASSETVRAQRPLAEARIELEEQEDNPGYYKARIYLRPHYQLEGLTTALCMESWLPGPGAA